MNFTCPVCFYNKLQEPPRDYNICVCCGTEFGSDDEFRTHAELRAEWTGSGARWFFGHPPFLWNPWQQLTDAKIPLPYQVHLTFSGVVNVEFARARPVIVVDDRLFARAA